MKSRVHGRRSRRAQAHSVTRGRVPPSTPGALGGSLSSHSHIQVVSRGESEPAEGDYTYEDDTPTFRSPSLQYIAQTQQVDKFEGEQRKARTFADMARSYTKLDMDGQEKPTSGPVPLARLVKLQPNSRKTNKSWRPLQMSDLGPDGDDSRFDTGDFSTLTDNLGMRRPATSQTHASPFDLPPLQTNMSDHISPVLQRSAGARTGSSSLPRTTSTNISPADGTYSIVDKYAHLFGKLPDQIHLHEKMGEFDGQTIFIGHPNRDVSAHQWSASSFQWVNIGRFSHSSGRVEGSLASDRVKGVNAHPHSIEYFKIAAEAREKVIRENGRQDEVSQLPRSVRPGLSGARRLASLSSASSPEDHSTSHMKLSHQGPQFENRAVATTLALGTVIQEPLEDPFVTPIKAPQPSAPAIPKFGSGAAAMGGSMDFGYEFPTKSTDGFGAAPSQESSSDQQQLYIQRERERIEQIRRIQPEVQPNLPEVGFGEEASNAFNTPYRYPSDSRVPQPMSPHDLHNRQKLKNKLAELANQEIRSNMTAERRVAVPDVSTLHKPIPPLMPPPGLTVANPYRVSSRLNAQAPPYTHTGPELQNTNASSEKPADDTLEASNLHFSDPDVAAQPDGYEVANGFIQGLPTPQNWKGPWFTQSMPTTHDPTASLYLPEDDETKLTKWYRDGQRYARQQDYAKSLIATANAGPKPRNLGVIGGGPVPEKIAGPDEFENTHQFVRLYEILNEYAEEYAAGSGKSYFTRHWKPAPESMRDMGPDGNNSFFKDVRVPSPKTKKVPAKAPEVRAPSGWPASIYETRPSPFSRGTTFMTLRNSPGTATSAVFRDLQHLRW